MECWIGGFENSENFHENDNPCLLLFVNDIYILQILRQLRKNWRVQQQYYIYVQLKQMTNPIIWTHAS